MTPCLRPTASGRSVSRADPGGGEGSLDSQRPQGQQGGSRGRGRGPWTASGRRVSRADPGGGEGSLDDQRRHGQQGGSRGRGGVPG